MKEYDISLEGWREYEYLESGKIYRINNPETLFIKEGGTGHRIRDVEGVVHWCPINILYIIRWSGPVEF